MSVRWVKIGHATSHFLVELMKNPVQKCYAFSEVDHQIISCLRTNPRQTNKAIAEQLGLSEVTVASRIRAMENNKVMKVMGQRDYRALGHNVLATVDVSISGRSVEKVGNDIAAIDGVATLLVLMGDPSIMLLAMAPSLLDMQNVILEKVAKVKGVHGIETMVYTEIIKFESGYAVL